LATRDKKPPTSFEVLAMCRKLADRGHISTKALSEKLGISRSALNAMVADGYKNKSFAALDGIRAEVRETLQKLKRAKRRK